MKRILLLLLIGLSFQAATAQGVRTLDEYLRLAMKNNPLVLDYNNQLRIQKIDSIEISSGNRLQLGLNGQLAVAPTINGYGFDSAITNGGNYSLVASATKNILNGGILRANYLQASFQMQSLNNTVRLTQHDLQRSIIAQYLQAYTDYSQYRYSKIAYELLLDEQRVLKQLVSKGLYRESAYLSFLVETQNESANLKQLKIQYKADFYTLNILAGINDTTSYALDSPAITLRGIPYTGTSAFLMQYRIDSFRIANEKRIVDLRYRPRLSLFADAGLNAVNPALIYRSFGAMAGLNFSMPIYDGGLRKLDYQKISIEESTRKSYESYFRGQNSARVQQLKQEMDATQQLIEDYRNQLRYAETLVSLYQEELNRGEASITDFILAIRNNLTIKNNLSQSQLRYEQIVNELNYWNW